MRELLSLSRVPTFDSEDVIRRTVTCERWLEPGLYRLDVASGHFSFECSCTHLEATEIHTLRGRVNCDSQGRCTGLLSVGMPFSSFGIDSFSPYKPETPSTTYPKPQLISAYRSVSSVISSATEG